LAEKPSLCRVPALQSRCFLACPDHAISSHDWTTDGVAGAEDGCILGRHTRPGGLTRLVARFMSRKCRHSRCGWSTLALALKHCSSSERICSQAIAVVGFPLRCQKCLHLDPLVYALFALTEIQRDPHKHRTADTTR
jgi:hypothetical protein